MPPHATATLLVACPRAGKTHTMSGTDIGEYSGRGLNYRALDDLFELNRARDAEVSYAISVQLLEIYNEVRAACSKSRLQVWAGLVGPGRGQL